MQKRLLQNHEDLPFCSLEQNALKNFIPLENTKAKFKRISFSLWSNSLFHNYKCRETMRKHLFLFLQFDIFLEVEVCVAGNDPRKVLVTGRGVQPKGLREGEPAVFSCFTKDAGQGELTISVLGPSEFNFDTQWVEFSLTA